MTALREIKGHSPCPCSSLERYRDCCGPLHAGKAEAPTAVALMRSRYAAFAAGNVAYLVRTLHPEHADRALPVELLEATLRNTVRSYRYTGLTIESDTEEGDRATVTFFAKVFERGTDRSFRERSQFRRTAEGWRYLSGDTLGLQDPSPRDRAKRVETELRSRSEEPGASAGETDDARCGNEA